MNEAITRRSTVYFDASLHEALRIKATVTHQSLSALVNDAVRESIAEDHEDLTAFEQRKDEPVISYEALLEDLKAHGKI